MDKLTCIPCIKGCSDLKLKDVKSYHGFNHDLPEFLKYSTHYSFHEFNDLFHIQDVIDTYKATYKKVIDALYQNIKKQHCLIILMVD